MKANWKITVALLTIVAVIVAVLSGCEEKKRASSSTDGETKIKVLTNGDEQSFYYQLGTYLSMEFPEIVFEIINPTTKEPQQYQFSPEEMENISKEKQPDLIIMNTRRQFRHMARRSLLASLDDPIAQEEINLEGRAPIADDALLTDGGDGKKYGLSSHFDPSLMVYNKGLFEQYGVDPLKGGETWPDLIKTGKRFVNAGSGESRISGFGFVYGGGDAFSYVNMMAPAEFLSLLDSKKEKLATNSAGWQRTVTLLRDAANAKVINIRTGEDMHNGPSDDYNFFQNNVAIVFVPNSGMVYNFEEQSRFSGKQGQDAKNLKWAVVKPPVDPKNPGESPYVQVHEIYACGKDSPHKAIVYKILNFIMSKKLAKATSRTSFSLPMHKECAKKFEGIDIDILYALKVGREVAPSMEEESSSLLPSRFFYESFLPSFNKMFEELLKDKTKTVSEGLNKLVMEGNKELIKARAKEKSDKAAGKKLNGFG